VEGSGSIRRVCLESNAQAVEVVRVKPVIRYARLVPAKCRPSELRDRLQTAVVVDMGHAPLFVAFTVHKAAIMQPERLSRRSAYPACTGPVRYASRSSWHTLAHEHERHPAAFVLLRWSSVQPTAVQERREVEIVRDYGFGSCGKVFCMHLCAPFGRYLLADRLNFSEDTGRPFFVRFQKLVKRIIGSFYVYLRYDIRFIDANGILFFFHAKRRCRTYV
jgi:hypothetical protein